jgi:hypothetical protein
MIVKNYQQPWKFGIFMANKITDMRPLDVKSSDTLYIFDSNLKFVYTKEEWARFTSENKRGGISGENWASKLLENMSFRKKYR